MQLRQQEQWERAQLIHDADTVKYLNNRRLICDPKHSEILSKSAANKFGRLSQGVGRRVKGTNTIVFIQKDQIPKDRVKEVTYGSFSCNMKPNKEKKECTRLTAGGDRINYPEVIGTPTADMTLVKIMLNSAISTKGARCVMLNVNDFNINTPMKRYEYVRRNISDIPEEIIHEYKLHKLVTKTDTIIVKFAKECTA
jgi:hypothetical protein